MEITVWNDLRILINISKKVEILAKVNIVYRGEEQNIFYRSTAISDLKSTLLNNLEVKEYVK